MPINPPFVPDIDLIDRYLAGELSPADAERVHQWTTSRADRDTLVEVLCGYARGVALERMVDVERGVRLLWKSPASAMRPHHERAPYAVERWLGKFSGRTLRRRVWTTALGLAVSALLIDLGYTGWASRNRSHTTAAAMTTYTTNAGQQANITLPDGSHVVLNVASQLQVPTDFARGDRMLLLTGEALFTVEHHTGGPFTVLAGGTTTRALGTTFLVRRYVTDTATMVVVQTGKVAVRSLVLAAGRQVQVPRSGMTYVQLADASQFSFATGVLTLDDVPLPNAIPELDRWYNVDVQLGDPSLALRRIDGRLTMGSLTDLTALLALTFHVRVVRDGRVLTLFPQ